MQNALNQVAAPATNFAGNHIQPRISPAQILARVQASRAKAANESVADASPARMAITTAVSQTHSYRAAKYNDELNAILYGCELVDKSQNVAEERSANHDFMANALALVDAITAKNKSLDEQVRADELKAMDDFAKQHGYQSWEIMSANHFVSAKTFDNTTPSNVPQQHGDDVASVSSVTASKQRNNEPKKPFDYLLKEEFNSGKCSFDLGYYERYGIKSTSKMARAFKRKHKIALAKEHFRPSEPHERDTMRRVNQAVFDGIKRRSPRAKKAASQPEQVQATETYEYLRDLSCAPNELRSYFKARGIAAMHYERNHDACAAWTAIAYERLVDALAENPRLEMYLDGRFDPRHDDFENLPRAFKRPRKKHTVNQRSTT